VSDAVAAPVPAPTGRTRKAIQDLRHDARRPSIGLPRRE
jgi:hypothetical protein